MPHSVLIALGSNLGDRRVHLLRAVNDLRSVIHLVRISPIIDTEPVDAPAGSGHFLNMVVAGYTSRSASELFGELKRIERQHGRRRSVRNAPRTLDLDLILYGAEVIRTTALVLPHPRYRDRPFVLGPFAALGLDWADPVTGQPIVARSRPGGRTGKSDPAVSGSR